MIKRTFGWSQACLIATIIGLPNPAWGASPVIDPSFAGDGTAKSILIAPANTPAQSSSSITTIGVPNVPDYWVSATRQPGGTIVFDGYAPDDETRDAFAAHPGADTQWLQLGRGATTGYRDAVAFGLSILDRLETGRFALRSTVITVSGTARTAQDYQAVMDALATQAPPNMVLARTEILPPKTDLYQWSATKSSDGTISLDGMVPDAAAEIALLAAAGGSSNSTLSYASGNPDDFLQSAQIGIDLLARLNEGRVSFDGAGWTLTGTPPTAAASTTIETDFAIRQLAAAGWSMALGQPPIAPAPTATLPTVPVVATQAEPEPLPTPSEPASTPSGDTACAAPLAEISARNAILFQSGAAILATESTPAIDELAATLAACPEAPVYVEGHTDGDGDDRQNLALSVARAEAVVAALVERGVTPARLYAVGYGETSPIADNQTAQGKRLNRRIVVTLSTGTD